MTCRGCNHALRDHVRNVQDEMICLHIDRGVSTSGVVGIPWSQVCDCLNGASTSRRYQDEMEAHDEQRRREVTDRILHEVFKA